MDTLAEIGTTPVFDHDNEPVNVDKPDLVEFAAYVDRMGFNDVALLLADYAYIRSAIAASKNSSDENISFWDAAAHCNRAAEC